MKKRPVLRIVLIVTALLALLSTLGVGVLAETPQPTTESETPMADEATTDDAPAPTATALLEGIIETRTPEPTATPGLIEEEVEKLAKAAGVHQS